MVEWTQWHRSRRRPQNENAIILLVRTSNLVSFKSSITNSFLLNSLTYRLKSCFMQTFERNSKHCSQKVINGLEALFGSYVTDTMGLICGDFNEENDKCDQILPKIPSVKKKGNSNSPIAILSDIFNSFPDSEV